MSRREARGAMALIEVREVGRGDTGEPLALLARWHKGEGGKFPEMPCALGPQLCQGLSRVNLTRPPGLP